MRSSTRPGVLVRAVASIQWTVALAFTLKRWVGAPWKPYSSALLELTRRRVAGKTLRTSWPPNDSRAELLLLLHRGEHTSWEEHWVYRSPHPHPLWCIGHLSRTFFGTLVTSPMPSLCIHSNTPQTYDPSPRRHILPDWHREGSTLAYRALRGVLVLAIADWASC